MLPARPDEYRFRSRWTVPVAVGHVYDVLVDVAGYPRWWPQVRAVARTGPDSALVVCRSALPYRLELQLTSTVQDRVSGVLEVAVDGDLRGWCRWHLTAADQVTRCRFEQRVRTGTRSLDLAGRWARPVLEWNHAWMMRGARRGLVRAGRERAAGTCG